MIFRSKKRNCLFSTDLRINGQTITRVESTRFLGVIIDEHLTWREHINTVKNKTSRGLGVICKARKLLNVSTIVSLYYAFIYPYLMYCIEVWGGALSSYKDVLIKIQKKIVRVMVSASYYAHTSPIFKKLNIMTLDKMYNYFICIFMFKVVKHIHPQIFDSMFMQNKNIHNYGTRHAESYCTLIAKTNLMKNSLRCAGVAIWNKYMLLIDCNCTLNCFKSRIKQCLLQ